MSRKQCTKCGEIKELDKFTRAPKRPQGCTPECKSCRSKRRRESYDPVKDRAKKLWNLYKITEKDYERMFEEQEGRCAICGTTDPSHAVGKRMSIDHDHVTGEVRGLLCSPCNQMLGYARDKPEVLRAGADYLEKFV